MEQSRDRRPYSGSHLSTVRRWPDDIGTPHEPQTEWRGKLQHVTSGEAHYFRDRPTLINLLQTLAAADAATAYP